MPADESENPAQSAPNQRDGAGEDPTAERFRVALDALETGDFGGARPIFGELIEIFPNNPEFLCGYYAAGWWFNREERRTAVKEGRAKADWLMNEWDAFQSLIDQREYSGCLAFRATMRAVLREAAEQYRIAFQEEGASAVDTNLLKTLAVCLIRLEDYVDASDILLYARRRQNQGDAQLHFLLGEALCSQEREDLKEKGMSYYRDACLIDVRTLDPGLMASEPAAGVFESLYNRFEHNLDRSYEWFPAYFHAQIVGTEGLRKLAPPEIAHLRSETDRLARDLTTVVEKYKDRVRATLAFYYLCLIHHLRIDVRDRSASREYEDRLKSLVPEVYTEFHEKLLS
ncbi:MAG: hypothetical protein NXI24_04195 [bacterium]|nr:hypothetical protein [bacterium]